MTLRHILSVSAALFLGLAALACSGGDDDKMVDQFKVTGVSVSPTRM
jgi:hypothetical protein